ncbi:hypothetical protein COR50_14720 [Chitinophaga caeni]|uniref:Uncharacterized protein n=1 Tax=Chitinophaga caeni TaxID=2029983 RepID=A0A291QWK7_9BACT|nr:hypothetical protein [Chitinophaga caeni]ATL48317.1 hypothetical protein COR50_14720 [Chitinophaga caeni]
MKNEKKALNVNLIDFLDQELKSLPGIFKQEVCERLNIDEATFEQMRSQNQPICSFEQQVEIAAVFNEIGKTLHECNADFMMDEMRIAENLSKPGNLFVVYT